MKIIIITLCFLFRIFLVALGQVIPGDRPEKTEYSSELLNLSANTPNYYCELIKQMHLSIYKGIVHSGYLIDETPLIHWLCLCDDFKLIKFVSNKKADLNITNKNGSTPLMFALYSGNEKIIRFLLDKKVLRNKKNKFGEGEIKFFVEGKSDNINLFNLLWSNSVLMKMDNSNFNKLLSNSIGNKKNNLYDYLWTLYIKRNSNESSEISWFISRAISSANLYVTKKLLSDYPLNQIPLDEPLIKKVSEKAHYYNLFARLYNEDKNFVDDSLDIKLLDLVVQKTKIDLDTVLVDGEDILFNMADNYPAIKYLLSKKKAVNRLDSSNKTFLQYFIDRITTGDSINFNGTMYRTDSLERDFTKEFNMVNSIIEHSGIINNKDYKNGWTYLILESINKYEPVMVEKLFKSQPAIFLKDENGKSAIDYALEYGDETDKTLIKQLLEKVG